ncbi:MAG: ribosome silencing factor [Saprospiraceae bacterium]|nr:ribosome silencing factor [Saprospiraceae bacterium]
MTRSSEARKIERTDALNQLIIDSISDTKGKQIIKLDLTELDDAPTDYFIVCQGDSSTQIRAIAENIRLKVKEATGEHPAHYEGHGNARWICIDYFDTVVHVFYPETRAFYALEELWSDAMVTEYDHL